MSAVPKKKLCWNCEGNVSRELDNCPYCGVYVHPLELEGESDWNPTYHPSSKTEEIPSPLYRIDSKNSSNEEEAESSDSIDEEERTLPLSHLLNKLKQDLFPLLFLLMGSGFFLFGIILLLFSQNGTFTLQWPSENGYYFFFVSIPLLFFGWKFLQALEE